MKSSEPLHNCVNGLRVDDWLTIVAAVDVGAGDSLLKNWRAQRGAGPVEVRKSVFRRTFIT